MSRTIEDILKLFPNTTVNDWKQHDNGGGWVANTASVAAAAYIGPDALAYGNDQVFGNARVYGNARVFGIAQVSGIAQVFGNAWVSGNARVFGNAQVSGNAWETSPLYIQGSAHCATNVKHGYIAIGCEVHTYAEWLKNYKAICAKAGYSEEQIKEYKAIIDLFVKVGR